MPFLMRTCLRNGFSPLQRIEPIIGNLCRSLIGALLLASTLTGCGAVRIGYNNAPSLSYWYLDRYFDFDSPQSLKVKIDLQSVHDWHRKEELPRLATAVAFLKSRALQDATAEPICQASIELQQRVVTTLEQMVPTLAAIAPNLSDDQLQHMADQYGKVNNEWREDYLDGTVAERNERRVKRSVERTEMFYGRLRAEQVALIGKQIAASAYDPQAMYREKLRRTEDILQVLRQIRAAPGTPVQGQAAVQALLQRSIVSPDPVYRQTLTRLTQQGCTALAELHNTMTPQQRRQLQETLQDYETDIRVLMGTRP